MSIQYPEGDEFSDSTTLDVIVSPTEWRTRNGLQNFPKLKGSGSGYHEQNDPSTEFQSNDCCW